MNIDGCAKIKRVQIIAFFRCAKMKGVKIKNANLNENTIEAYTLFFYKKVSDASSTRLS